MCEKVILIYLDPHKSLHSNWKQSGNRSNYLNYVPAPVRTIGNVCKDCIIV